MIKANELRIGNLVFNLWTQPISVDWGNIKWSQDVNAIPLTDDWLLKFGFETVGGIYGLHTGEIEIYRTSKGTIVIDVEGQALVLDNIKNVHQLQNLYFALTGEELTA